MSLNINQPKYAAGNIMHFHKNKHWKFWADLHIIQWTTCDKTASTIPLHDLI